jgi:hypothetical protein
MNKTRFTLVAGALAAALLVPGLAAAGDGKWASSYRDYDRGYHERHEYKGRHGRHDDYRGKHRDRHDHHAKHWHRGHDDYARWHKKYSGRYCPSRDYGPPRHAYKPSGYYGHGSDSLRFRIIYDYRG